jgi:hypothetical protein
MNDVELLKSLEDAYRRACVGGFDGPAVLAEIEHLEREASHRFDERIEALSAPACASPRPLVQ